MRRTKNRIKLLLIIIILGFALAVFLNKENLVMLLNNQLDEETKQIMKEKMDFEHIKAISLRNDDITNFKEQVKLNDYIQDNQDFYDYLNSISKANNELVVLKANVYIRDKTSLEMVKSYNSDGARQKEFVRVLEQGANNHKDALLVIDPESIESIANKRYYLSNYVPNDLVLVGDYINKLDKDKYYLKRDTNEALMKLCSAMEKEFDGRCGDMVLTSSYRSFKEQEYIYKTEVGDSYEASLLVQTPGSSEHQLGNTFDFMVTGYTKNGFKNTKQYQWIQENKSKYGFVLRYPANKLKVTGIAFEPWHYRYLGESLATKVNDSQLSLEEYFKK
jgi:D-alanyl-D-alanine carboxypeptidase